MTNLTESLIEYQETAKKILGNSKIYKILQRKEKTVWKGSDILVNTAFSVKFMRKKIFYLINYIFKCKKN